MISVIIPLYNKEHYIQSTIQSVLQQTYNDFEIIIIDDGSTDNSVKIVQSVFHDPRIRLYKQKNGGVSCARNRGIELAKGDYIDFLDADDQWMPNYLEKMIALTIEYQDFSVYATTHNGHKIPQMLQISIIDDYCKYPYLFSTGSMFIKRNVFKETGVFREGIQRGEDRDMWLRIACKFATVYLNEELTYHLYETENNLSRTVDIVNSFPYWEWYNYPYPNKQSLYKYTTSIIVRKAQELVEQKRYKEAWQFFKKAKGFTAVRPRIKLLFDIILKSVAAR